MCSSIFFIPCHKGCHFFQRPRKFQFFLADRVPKPIQMVTSFAVKDKIATKVGTWVALCYFRKIKSRGVFMKTNLKLLMSMSLLLVLSSVTQAQVQTETLSADVDSEIDQMYQSTGRSNQTQGSVVSQTVVVPQQAVQKQPTTVVEASPLSDSRADNIRRNRQDEEMRTESKIVEKLEQSRMEDEKRRAAVLFGDKFENMQNGQQQPVQQQPAAAVQPVQAPTSQIQPQPIVIQQNETLSRDAVREEIRAALNEDATAVTPAVQQKYFAGVAGIAQYPDIKAIEGNYTLGAAFGTRYDFFMVEGAFLFSNYGILGASYLAQNNFVYLADFEMNQYQGMVAAKYQLLDGFVRPVLGGLVSYSYRRYSATTPTTYGPSGTEFGTSHAVDLGVIAGVDLEFNDKMSIGVDMKYMFNMSSRIDGSSVGGALLPEKAQYYITGLTARVNF